MERLHVNSKVVLALGRLKRSLLLLLQFLHPVDDNLLELGACQVAEGGITAESVGAVALLVRLFESVTKSFAEIRELGVVRISAEGSHDILPVLEIGVVHDVPEVLANNAGQKTQVVRSLSLLLQVSALRLVDAGLAAANSDHEGVRHTILLQANVKSSVELAQHECLGDTLVGRRLLAGVNREWVVRLRTLRSSKIRKEAVTVASASKEVIVVLFAVGSGLVLAIDAQFLGLLGQNVIGVVRETQVLAQLLARLARVQSLDYLPVRFLLVCLGFLDLRLANTAQVARK